MTNAITPARASLGGTSIIMACACGAATSTVKLIALAGIAGATTKFMHPGFFGVGAALILYGLWRTARQSAYIAGVAFAIIALAAWITPPGKMTMTGSTMAAGHPGLPWDATLMTGAALYVIGAAVLAYAFWRAFPSRKPAASATAIGGMVVATGCTCCVVTGAIAGMAVTAGASASFESSPILFWSGLSVVAIGLYRLGGLRAALWVPIGGLIVKYAPSALKYTGDWVVGGVNLRFAPSYLITVIGAGAILYGFAVAYRRSRAIAAVPEQIQLAA